MYLAVHHCRLALKAARAAHPPYTIIFRTLKTYGMTDHLRHPTVVLRHVGTKSHNEARARRS